MHSFFSFMIFRPSNSSGEGPAYCGKKPFFDSSKVKVRHKKLNWTTKVSTLLANTVIFFVDGHRIHGSVHSHKCNGRSHPSQWKFSLLLVHYYLLQFKNICLSCPVQPQQSCSREGVQITLGHIRTLLYGSCLLSNGYSTDLRKSSLINYIDITVWIYVSQHAITNC